MRKSGPHSEVSLVMIVAGRPVVRALYGLESSGAAFRVHLAVCMHEMGYMSCPPDPYLWLNEQTDRKGIWCYSYILCYVDGLLVVHHHPKRIMDKINSFLPLRPDSAGPPEMYLVDLSQGH